jgi:hypothetical protein
MYYATRTMVSNDRTKPHLLKICEKWGIVANLGFFELHANSSSMHLGFELLNLVLLSNTCLFQ